MKLPLVSIGVPTYNRSTQLQRAILLLLLQSYPNIEIIISDNASNDETEATCIALQNVDTRIRYFRQDKNLGAVPNFNFTLSKASGAFFMWASDDDMWHPQYISTIMNAYDYSDQSIGLICTRCIAINQDNTSVKIQIEAFKNKSVISFKDYLYEPIYKYRAYIFYGIYRINILRSINGYCTCPCISSSDQLTLYELLSKTNCKILEKRYFYKKMELLLYQMFSRNESIIKRVKLLFNVLWNLITNLYPSNFKFIYLRVKNYYMNTNRIINSINPNDILYYKFRNLVSATELFVNYSIRAPERLRSSEKNNGTMYFKCE